MFSKRETIDRSQNRIYVKNNGWWIDRVLVNNLTPHTRICNSCSEGRSPEGPKTIKGEANKCLFPLSHSVYTQN